MNLLQREIKRFRDAIHGVIIFFHEGEHATFHLFFAVVVTGAGFYFDINTADWYAVIFSITIVFIAEAFNTALELLGDFVHVERHPDMKKIKDMAAGAVLLAALGAAITGCIIFIPQIFPV